MDHTTVLRVCGPDSRRYLISWLPRAQLSLSKELFQLESPPPTPGIGKIYISRLYYMKQDTLDFSRRINQTVFRTSSGVLEIQPLEKEKKWGREGERKDVTILPLVYTCDCRKLIKVKLTKTNECRLQVATYRKKN